MALKLNGDVVVHAPRDKVWELLFDVGAMRGMGNKIPGVKIDHLEQVAPDRYELTATIKVAMVKGTYNLQIQSLSRRPPEYVSLHGEGKADTNSLTGDLALTLTDQDGETSLHYEGTGNIRGPLASLGQRLVDTVGRQFVASGAKALAEELSVRSRSQDV